jgi:hypothetical protein
MNLAPSMRYNISMRVVNKALVRFSTIDSSGLLRTAPRTAMSFKAGLGGVHACLIFKRL